jgi:hypothetical protein
MNTINRLSIILTGCFVLMLIWQPTLPAAQGAQKSAALAVFSNEKRPEPQFDHTRHEESLGESGCARCHHVFDKEQNKLVYAEGEESACYECHLDQQDKNTLSLRDASHAGCTGCHRALKKQNKPAGPTTCGECHKK